MNSDCVTAAQKTRATKILLAGLGKATRRGVRNCHKCGQRNGTRSFACKNKLCGVVFREQGEKGKASPDAVKLLTEAARRVYSVRVRDGLDDSGRGFVQLPMKKNNSGPCETALCFVDNCRRQFDVSILKCHEPEPSRQPSPLCVHIESALISCSIAVPLALTPDLIKASRCPPEIKEKLSLLVMENEAPIVQRVSKNVLAVKCQVTPKHPLGYLHFTLFSSGAEGVYDEYYCGCWQFSKQTKGESKQCIHYYACVCAFAADKNLSKEFEQLIS